MKYRRRSIRLKGYDYTNSGAYYITICTYNKKQLFGQIVDGKMCLNLYGQIVEYKWNNIEKHFKNAHLDVFQIMPDHLHGIIMLDGRGNVGAKHSKKIIDIKYVLLDKNASPLQRPCGTKPQSISAIIQNFSSISTRKINQIRKTPGEKLWQRNYYERIIHNNQELNAIRGYIIYNPLNWNK